MARQIAAGMQDIDDEDFLRPVQKHEEVLPCPDLSQVFGIIDKDRTASAVCPAAYNGIAMGKEFHLVDIRLTRSEGFDGSAGYLDEAFFRTACEPESSAHDVVRALAKARRTASTPLPSAKSPRSAC